MVRSLTAYIGCTILVYRKGIKFYTKELLILYILTKMYKVLFNDDEHLINSLFVNILLDKNYT